MTSWPSILSLSSRILGMPNPTGFMSVSTGHLLLFLFLCLTGRGARGWHMEVRVQTTMESIPCSHFDVGTGNQTQVTSPGPSTLPGRASPGPRFVLCFFFFFLHQKLLCTWLTWVSSESHSREFNSLALWRVGDTALSTLGSCSLGSALRPSTCSFSKTASLLSAQGLSWKAL